MAYGNRSNGKEHGAVMTKKEVVAFMLNSCGYSEANDLSEVTLLEPAGGEGAFVLECLRRLAKSAERFDFNFEHALTNLMTCELDPHRASALRKGIFSLLAETGVKEPERFAGLVHEGDFLIAKLDSFDIVVGNPPYIRHEQIPEGKKVLYREKFRTFKGRSDIYIAFFENALSLLKKGGKLCYICSDRWMRSSYGKELRKLLSTGFNVPWILNLNAADAFDEKVYGYPSIVMIAPEAKGETAHFEIKQVDELESVAGQLVNGAGVHRQWLPEDGSPWALGSERMELMEEHLVGIESQGFKIGIGVATGLDHVFIGRELKDVVEDEVLLPLVLPQDLVDGKLLWTGNYVINPFENGSSDLLELPKYPRLSKYFNSSVGLLKNRHIAKRRPSHWYRTIDRIYPHIRETPKLLLPDIKKNQKIVFDEGKYYPHHNVYYITGGSINNLKLLGAILMSDFVFKQMKSVSTIMHGGFVRWQSQNLRRIRIPVLLQMPESVKTQLVHAFEKGDVVIINQMLGRYLTDASSPPSITATARLSVAPKRASANPVTTGCRNPQQKRVSQFLEG